MADILITDMEMPKSCYSEVYSENGFCPFHCFDYHGGSHCTMSACKCLKTRRPKDCPLIPIVHCKDCENFNKETDICTLWGSWTNEDGFCHKAVVLERTI